MNKQQLTALDLFCGAGGASMGLHRAGFEVTGVDIKPQPRYPFRFIQADALEVLTWKQWAWESDFIWASPPCQGYSHQSRCRAGLAERYPKLVEKVRERLVDTGVPYVIENVYGAPLSYPVMLCMAMFGLDSYRHRYFESSHLVMRPHHPRHRIKASKSGHWKPGTYISVAGNCAPIKLAKQVMEIDWMTRKELSEAIPPAYSQFIGERIKAQIESENHKNGLKHPS